MKKLWEKVKKVILWKPDMRLVAVLAVTALLLLLIPLLRMTIYTIPWYDDYGYASNVKNFLALDYTLANAWKGALYCVKTQWYAWQGTFSSCFFMAVAPLAWKESCYFLGPLFLICILAAAAFVLSWTCLRRALGADAPSSVILSAAAAAILVEFIHSDRAGFYWYNSGIHYVGMHAMLMLTTAVWIRLLTGKGKVTTVFLSLLAVLGASIGGGANYVTALQGLVLIVSFIVLGILLRRQRTLLLLPSLAVYAFAFYKNVSAPGNNVRQAYFTGLGPAASIGQSFLAALRNMWKFTGIRTVLLLILLVPVIWRVVKRASCKFSCPGLVLLWSFCFYATGFTPSFYAMGHEGLGRTLNAVKITWQILLLLNVVYWLGWLQNQTHREGRMAAAARLLKKRFGGLGEGIPLVHYLLIAALSLLVFHLDFYQAGDYSSFCAYYFVHTGEANEFHKEYLKRVEMIKNGGSVVEVPPYHFIPSPIFIGELSTDPNNEANRFMANWYGKEAIMCEDKETQ